MPWTSTGWAVPTFAAGVFTNLSQDHLDYHGTMDAYFAAKEKLFTRRPVALAVVNRADPWGASADQPAGGVQPIGGHLRARRRPRRRGGPGGAVVHLVRRGGSRSGWGAFQRRPTPWPRRPRPGSWAPGGTPYAAGLAGVEPVRGRFQVVDVGQPFGCWSICAHAGGAGRSPKGRPGTDRRRSPPPTVAGRVLIVFGAGGDRDRAKRPAMGEVAEQVGRRGDHHLRQPPQRKTSGHH